MDCVQSKYSIYGYVDSLYNLQSMSWWTFLFHVFVNNLTVGLFAAKKNYEVKEGENICKEEIIHNVQ
ncbi:hypothetical protein GDO86_010375 [Hymenochirus boettgeri]|uniref:Uncharacterized protein n=1 Tax=Hymenochirus boettgeri TaxID=247094 RepID=A0A8T2JPT7_9PIPI|nr:hypothetical protein GDO86_010375 [Hymenochirus boettgeri]